MTKKAELKVSEDKTTHFVIAYQQMIKTVDIDLNTGQIPGLPQNPRYILEKGQNDLKNSIQEDPEFLLANPLVVIPYAHVYVVIAGNMRLQACIEIGIFEVPCIVLNPNTPIEKLKRFMVKDNILYGKHDWDILANEFEAVELEHWGLELPDIESDSDGSASSDDKLKDPEIKLTIHFKGNLDQYDRIKARVEDLVKDFEFIEIGE